MAIQIAHGPAAQPDDVPEMGDARQIHFRGDRPGKPPHRQAVGVEQVRAQAGQQLGEMIAQPPLRESHAGGFGVALPTPPRLGRETGRNLPRHMLDAPLP